MTIDDWRNERVTRDAVGSRSRARSEKTDRPPTERARGQWWGILRALVARQSEMPPSALRVWLALFVQSNNGKVARGVAQIRADTGLSRHQVSRATRWLEDHGYLRKSHQGRNGRGVNEWWIRGRPPQK